MQQYKEFFPTVSRLSFFSVARFPKVAYDRRVSCTRTSVGYTRGPGREIGNKHSSYSPHPVMPKPSKIRRAALQREERRRLERESNSTGMLLQSTESPVAETKTLQPRGGSRTSKWRDENGKTKKSRAVRMQPSVLNFFSVSNRDTHRGRAAVTRLMDRFTDGQPIHAGEAAGVGVGNNSTLSPEASTGSQPLNVLANLAPSDSGNPRLGTGEVLIQAPHRAAGGNNDPPSTTVMPPPHIVMRLDSSTALQPNTETESGGRAVTPSTELVNLFHGSWVLDRSSQGTGPTAQTRHETATRAGQRVEKRGGSLDGGPCNSRSSVSRDLEGAGV